MDHFKNLCQQTGQEDGTNAQLSNSISCEEVEKTIKKLKKNDSFGHRKHPQWDVHDFSQWHKNPYSKRSSSQQQYQMNGGK